MKPRPRTRKTNHRLIATGLTLLLIVFAIIVLTQPSSPRTPAAILQSNYDHLGLSNPTSITNSGTQIQAIYAGLNSFSKIHNEVLSQGWRLTNTVFDTNGNPVYTYTKTYRGTALQLVLKQDITSSNDRKTDSLMLVLIKG